MNSKFFIFAILQIALFQSQDQHSAEAILVKQSRPELYDYHQKHKSHHRHKRNHKKEDQDDSLEKKGGEISANLAKIHKESQKNKKSVPNEDGGDDDTDHHIDKHSDKKPKHKKNIHDLTDNMSKGKGLHKSIHQIQEYVDKKKPLVINSTQDKVDILKGINNVERALEKIKNKKHAAKQAKKDKQKPEKKEVKKIVSEDGDEVGINLKKEKPTKKAISEPKQEKKEVNPKDEGDAQSVKIVDDQKDKFCDPLEVDKLKDEIKNLKKQNQIVPTPPSPAQSSTGAVLEIGQDSQGQYQVKINNHSKQQPMQMEVAGNSQ